VQRGGTGKKADYLDHPLHQRKSTSCAARDSWGRGGELFLGTLWLEGGERDNRGHSIYFNTWTGFYTSELPKKATNQGSAEERTCGLNRGTGKKNQKT